MTDFQQFMERREAAAGAYCRGESQDVDAISTRREPATFFSPSGQIERGPDAVLRNYRDGAAQFGPHGESSFEVLQMAAGADVAYWTGLQHASLEVGGNAVRVDLRVTELFRREDGEWKLVHRHADQLYAG